MPDVTGLTWLLPCVEGPLSLKLPESEKPLGSLKTSIDTDFSLERVKPSASVEALRCLDQTFS